jgi:exportin-T
MELCHHLQTQYHFLLRNDNSYLLYWTFWSGSLLGHRTRIGKRQVQKIQIQETIWPCFRTCGLYVQLIASLSDHHADQQACRSSIEHISNIDKSLHTEVVANIVGSTLNTLQTSGPSAVPWQQAELALHLVYTFGEMAKSKSWVT